MLPPFTLAELLETAATIIDRGGLARNRATGPGARHSVEGAIDGAYRALGGFPSVHGWGITDRARSAVARAITLEGSLQRWSDEATDEEAIGALLLAADAAYAAASAPRPALAGAGHRNPHEW